MEGEAGDLIGFPVGGQQEMSAGDQQEIPGFPAQGGCVLDKNRMAIAYMKYSNGSG